MLTRVGWGEGPREQEPLPDGFRVFRRSRCPNCCSPHLNSLGSCLSPAALVISPTCPPCPEISTPFPPRHWQERADQQPAGPPQLVHQPLPRGHPRRAAGARAAQRHPAHLHRHARTARQRRARGGEQGHPARRAGGIPPPQARLHLLRGQVGSGKGGGSGGAVYCQRFVQKSAPRLTRPGYIFYVDRWERNRWWLWVMVGVIHVSVRGEQTLAPGLARPALLP